MPGWRAMRARAVGLPRPACSSWATPAEHLPLSPGRAAGSSPRGRFARWPGRRPAELRPHAPQRAGRLPPATPSWARPGAARDHRFSRPHHRIQTPGQPLRLPAITDDVRAMGNAAHDPLAWRDSLTEPPTRSRRNPAHARMRAGRRLGAAHRQRHPAQRGAGDGPQARPPGHARRPCAPCTCPACSLKSPTCSTRPGAGHGGAARCAGLAHARPVAITRALKSPLFGLGDDALVALAVLRRQPEHAGCSWFDLLLKSELLAPDLQALGPV